MMDISGRQKTEAGVMMLGVVPGEEDVAVGPSVLDRAESVGELRPVLQRLELGLRERVVVGHVRPGVRLGDPRSANRNATDFEIMAEPRSA